MIEFLIDYRCAVRNLYRIWRYSNISDLMEGMSLQDTLNMEDSILVKGECRDEYRKYVFHLILLLRNKISEGSLLEAVAIKS